MQYIATGNILRNGNKIKPGDLIDLTQDEAKPLLETGCIEVKAKPFTASNLAISIDLGETNV